MNRIIASFTSSERNIITFVLLVVAGGYGLLHWQNNQQTTMTFTANTPAVTEEELSPAEVLPKGMDTSGRIDVNSADQKLLETLPGVGPSLAGALVRHRESKGAFTSMADLDSVPGIGPAMMTKLEPMVEFGGAASVAPAGGALPAAQVTPLTGMASAAAPGVVPALPAPVNSMVPVGVPQTAGAVSAFSSNEAPVNINTADAAQLDTLKGIGPALAKRILQDRQRGPYRSVEELKRVKGIGPKILEDNRHRLVIQ